ncbi:hypothetical protein ABK040_007686 [Willaertia magna]
MESDDDRIIVGINNSTGQPTLQFHNKIYRCSVGKSGIGYKEKEGDGITPIGNLPIRLGFYRFDKLQSKSLQTLIPMIAIQKDFGWCDDSQDILHYNRLIKIPFKNSYENLWREDNLYDILLVLGYNDNPVVLGKGSAIFMHVAREGYIPTAGCIALKREDLVEILEKLTVNTVITVRPYL